MTVKDAIQILKHAKDIRLAYGDNCVPFSHQDALMVEAYGDFVVEEIQSHIPECYELTLLLRPVKKEA